MFGVGLHVCCVVAGLMENLWEASLRGNLTSIRRSINLYGSQKVNEYDQKGITPLFLAASENKLDAVELLVTCGADVNLRSKVRQHPLTLEQELSL